MSIVHLRCPLVVHDALWIIRKLKISSSVAREAGRSRSGRVLRTRTAEMVLIAQRIFFENRSSEKGFVYLGQLVLSPSFWSL